MSQILGKDGSNIVRPIACSSAGHLLVDTNGDDNNTVKCMGSEDGTITGTQNQIHVDGSGNVLVKEVGTVNVAPANSLNSGITDATTDSVCVGLTGRQDKALASSETYLVCDAQGHLQVDLLNQNVEAQLAAFTDITNVGSVKRLLCDADGHLQVDIVSGGGGGSGNANTFPTLASITTATNFAGGIVESNYIDLTNAKNVIVNCIHTGDATARTNFGSDIAISMEFTDDDTNTVCYSGASTPVFGSATLKANGDPTGDAVAVLSLGENSDAIGAITGKFGRVVAINNDVSGTGTAFAINFEVVISGI
tara:strand:+ start:62 stop:985 length:924 start_codon:yes stop_codon:yes gene_type:complete